MANTPNFNLYKPSRADNLVEVDVSLADNFTKIDTELQNNKGGLDAHINNSNAHTSENVTHADGSVKTTLENHEERLTTGEQASADHEGRISSNETELADHETRVSSLETSTTGIDARVTDIETLGIDKLAPNLEGRITTLESDIEGHLAPATFEALSQQNYTFDDLRMGYVDSRLADIATKQSNMWVDLVKDYAADPTGGTNSATIIQNAVNAVQSNGTGVIFFGGKSNTFLINSTITIDPSKVTLIGFGAKIQFGNATTTIKIAGVSSYQAYSKAISGIEIVGAGKTAAGGVGVTFSDASGSYGTDTFFENVIIRDVYTGITWSNNAWLNSFKHCAIYNCTYAIDYPSGLNNSGEEITFSQCAIYNSTNGIRNKSGEMIFTDCSVDYITNRFIDVQSGGRVTLQNCHIEGSSDSEYWLYTQDSWSTIYVKGGSITVMANKSAFQVGKNTNLDGGIHLDGVTVALKSGMTYGFQALFTGVGTSKNMLPYNASTAQWCVSVDSLNYLVNGSFETANLNEWTIGGTHTPVIDATVARTGVNSLKLNAASTKYINIYKEINITPGQKPRISFWALGNFGTSTDTFRVEARYYDSTGTSINSPTFALAFSASTTNGVNGATWTKFFVNPYQPAPAGTAKIRFSFQQALASPTSDGLATMWFDDIIITVE